MCVVYLAASHKAFVARARFKGDECGRGTKNVLWLRCYFEILKTAVALKKILIRGSGGGKGGLRKFGSRTKLRLPMFCFFINCIKAQTRTPPKYSVSVVL